MASSLEPPKTLNLPEANQDLISNLPSIATDKILKNLPIHMAANMSVLSTQWRRNWLSHRYLVFPETLCCKGEQDPKGALTARMSHIITNILLHHNGPIHKFHLEIPEDYPQEGPCISPTLNQWLSLLSTKHVKKIALINFNWDGDDDKPPAPSQLFLCRELLKLELASFFLNPLPSDFQGFANLRKLKLFNVVDDEHDMVGILTASCPRLTVISLDRCSMDRVIIDAPILERLSATDAVFNYIGFKNVACLKDISLSFDECMVNDYGEVAAVDSIKHLATSCELEYLELGGRLCQFLVVGGFTNSLPFAFNHLNRLCFTELNFNNKDESLFVTVMVQSSPCIKDLEISISDDPTTPNNYVGPNKYFYKDDFKLCHLLRIEITGMTGSRAELEFIEYILSISVVLEELLYGCLYLGPTSELSVSPVSKALLQIPKASTKAQIVCLVE